MFIITHPKLGAYLGQTQDGLFWSACTSGGATTAYTFDSEDKARNLIKSYKIAPGYDTRDLAIVEVEYGDWPELLDMDIDISDMAFNDPYHTQYGFTPSLAIH